MRAVFIFSLFLVLFTAGCIEGFPGLWAGMGEEKEAPPDVLVIDTLAVIPEPPIPADSEFSMELWVKNEDEYAEAEDVVIELYDWGRCDPVDLERPGTTRPITEDKTSTTRFLDELSRDIKEIKRILNQNPGKCPDTFRNSLYDLEEKITKYKDGYIYLKDFKPSQLDYSN